MREANEMFGYGGKTFLLTSGTWWKGEVLYWEKPVSLAWEKDRIGWGGGPLQMCGSLSQET